MALAHHRGRAGRGGGAGQRGPPIAILAPIVAPKKPSVCREKPQGPGVRALWGQQWTRLPFGSISRREKYCHNGGIAFAPHRGGGYRACRQVTNRLIRTVGGGRRSVIGSSWKPRA
jgi:hypothetical protein